MVFPVPGSRVSAAYGVTGSSWRACGYHTGIDLAAARGANIVAARPGTVRHVNYGSAFGDRQFIVIASDGTCDFYAHCDTRPSNGAKVNGGQRIAKVGARGNVTGPHLHFERHKSTSGWSCGNIVNPQPSIDWRSSGGGGGSSYPRPTSNTVYLSRLKYGQRDSDSVWYAQRALGMPSNLWTGNYLDKTDSAVRSCQGKHVPPADPPKKSFIGPKQAAHLFPSSSGIRVVDDRNNPVSG